MNNNLEKNLMSNNLEKKNLRIFMNNNLEKILWNLTNNNLENTSYEILWKTIWKKS